MDKSGNIAKYICIGLGGVVVVLLIAIAFLLGQRSGEKKTPTAATTETGAVETLPQPQETTSAPATQIRPAHPSDETTAQPVANTDAPETIDAPGSLDISMSAGSLTFVEGQSFHVDFDSKVISVKEDGDTVRIENAQRHPSASERRRMNVTVTVPVGYVFDNVDIEFGAGKLIVHTLHTDTLDLELGAGSATLDDLVITGSAEIQEGAGELVIKSGTIANLSLQCGAGATRVAAALTGTSRVDAAVGAVDLKLEGDQSDYTVAFQMGLGACYYNNEKIARSGAFGDGPSFVQINGAFGVMRVNAG